jgi:holo-ACP synthase/triphosphoribosyl-dephospho-CoA synthase
MNIPGTIKISRLISESFREGAYRIDKQLQRGHGKVLLRELLTKKTGYEGFWLLDADPCDVKSKMIQIEASCDLGRLFDIDVILPNMERISRTDLGYSQRRCMICDKPAHECARSQYHSQIDLIDKTQEIMKTFFYNKRAKRVAETACKSLLYEISITPKPGLVDRFDNGAHNDMDFFKFLDSAAVLTPEFYDFYFLGVKNGKCPPQELFDLLRYPGMHAEDLMRDATNGCNTHKGLIFSLGILCAALGWHDANGKETGPEDLLMFCGEMVKEQVTAELEKLSQKTAQTGGERLFIATKNGGIRTEAVNGYPTVRKYGLPALHRYLKMGLSYNDAGVYTLLEILTHAQDSNVFSRCGAEMQSIIAAQVQDLLNRTFPMDFKEIERLNDNFIRENISPGGSADLLAVTFFIYFLFFKKD